MLYSDFVLAVESHLAVEANRRGLEAFRARYMRNALIDLQEFIPGYRQALKTTYESTDLTEEGEAQLVTLPQQAILKQAEIVWVDAEATACDRHKLEFYPWNRRQELVCGSLNFLAWWGCCWPIGGCPNPPDDGELADWESKAYVYTQSPMSRTLLIYPQITASTRLVITYDGWAYDLDPADDVPFPEYASEAVAAYVGFKIAGNVDKDRALAADRFAEYQRLRLGLYRKFREQFLTNESEAEQYGATPVAP